MWKLKRSLAISSAHHLENYVGKCANVHGHNWRIIVYCKGDKLDERGILVDFVDIKKAVMHFDHKDLNMCLADNPTAENFAKRIHEMIPHCYKVEVWEGCDSMVEYVED